MALVDVGSFEQRPLSGRRVVVTRTREQAGELSHLLRRRGAAPVEVPTIRITDPDDDGAALDGAIAGIAGYAWVVLTSPNGATRLCARLPDARQLGGVGVAAIGPGTAAALAEHDVVADLVPDEYVAESLLAAFPPPPPGGGRVLIARAAEAREVLPEGLRARGWTVDVVPAYRTEPATVSDEQQQAVAEADAVTFTSSSTVRHFVELVGADAVPPVVACIGPVTAATARQLGLSVDVEAAEHTIAGLVRALEEHYGSISG